MMPHKTKALLLRSIQSVKSRQKKKITIADWQKLPEDVHVELINGKLVYETMAGFDHGTVMGNLYSLLRDPYGHSLSGSDEKPGGWWFSLDVDIKFGPHGLRPDVAGWRRDKYPNKPRMNGQVTLDPPDWVAEVLSTSTMGRDWGDKHRIYHQYKVSHYWLLDRQAHTLTTLVWTKDTYELECFGGPNDTLNAAPFSQAKISIQELFDLAEPTERPKHS